MFRHDCGDEAGCGTNLGKCVFGFNKCVLY
jgi:hypothetical protein